MKVEQRTEHAGGPSSMPIVIRSQKGGEKLCFKGYVYTRQTDNRKKVLTSTDIRWRCVQRLSKCRGTALTDAEKKTISIVIDHNHISDNASTTFMVALDKMKIRAACSKDKPSVIVADAIKDLPSNVRAEMPSTSVIKRTLRNQRTAKHPPVPKTLNEFAVTGEWTTTGDVSQLPFLFHDSGAGNGSRIVAFATEQCLKVLSSSTVWFMDGNFAMAPKLFKQVN